MDTYGSIKFHRMLINDHKRTDAYREAILKTVQEGDVVLDIGTGSGILAFLACQAGAARVYAVDSSDIVTVAGRLAQDNDLAERITFIKGDIRSIALPESVDVIVSELITKAVIGERMEELVGLCRDQFLKPGGRLIPQSVELTVAPVEAPDEYEKIEFPAPQVYDLDFAHARQLAFNNVHSTRFQPENLLAEGEVAYRVDLLHATKTQHPDATLRFVALREGVLHGFCGWFSAVLADNVVLSTYPPGLPSWDNVFFPLLDPVRVRPGMTIELHLRGVHPPGTNSIWQWKTVVRDAPESEGDSRVLAQFEQSTFAGSPLSRDTILRRSSKYQPALSPSGQMVKSILTWCDGKVAVHEMAERLRADYPDSVGSYGEAEELVQATLLSLCSGGHLA